MNGDSTGGVLGSRLASLDIPNTARLVSVKMATASDGSTEWTVVFRSKPDPQTPQAQADLPPISMATNASSSPAPVKPLPPPIVSTEEPLQNLRMDRLFPLKCQVKTYAWGKLGEESLVARLAAKGLDEVEAANAHPPGLSRALLPPQPDADHPARWVRFSAPRPWM